MVGPVVQPDGDEELRRQRKKEKKENKRLDRERSAVAAAQQQPEQPTVSAAEAGEEESESEEARRQRKAEKRERKRKRREEEAATTGVDQTAHADAAPHASKSAKRSATSGPSSSTTSPPSAAFTSEEADAYRTLHRIQISAADSHIYPIGSFAAAGFLPSLLAATASFSAPSPIQSQCWPVLMQHRDAVAIADTGSGQLAGTAVSGCCGISD